MGDRALAEAHDVASSLLDLCEVVPVCAQSVREAMRLAARYQLSHWDSVIVAAATLPATSRCIRKISSTVR